MKLLVLAMTGGILISGGAGGQSIGRVEPCAGTWILWDHESASPVVGYTEIWNQPLAAFENKQQCDEAAAAKDAWMVRVNHYPPGMYGCFPDTFNPRR